MEIIKFNAEEFGGLQTELLEPWERVQRFCCALGCPQPGAAQMRLVTVQPVETVGAVPTYRLFCKRHIVQYLLLVGSLVGDPDAIAEARLVADAMGIDFDMMLDLCKPPTALFDPPTSRCIRCGGRFVVEQIGMFSGQRYVHNCGISKREGT